MSEAEAHEKFATERTRRWKQTELKQEDARTIRHIEETGCSIISVEGASQALSWSYSIGNFDVCGRSEIITVGLKSGPANYLVNEAVRQLREGVDLTVGRHREMLGDVECEFRTVDPKWVTHLMGWALWYYDHESFPVLQAVYPDLENRFSGEADFDERFAQPSLQTDAPFTQIEQDFWAANDPKSSLFDWPFADGPHTGVFLSKAVHNGTEAIVYVSHDPDGDWQFLGDSMADGGGPVVVCFHHPVESDTSLKELADLPIGWYAERATSTDAWVWREKPDKAEE